MTTENMKPYPAYKDSGIEWIGEIPEGWEVKHLKHVVKLINEKTDDVHDCKFKIELENIESFTGKLLNNLGTFEGMGNRFKKGDVLFNKLRPYLCKVVLVPDDGISVGELLTFRTTNSLSNKFLLYRLLSTDFISIVNGSTYGTKMPRASWEFIGNIKCPIPPLSEQQSIATFLDNQTSKIDTLIENKQKQIELLKEERTAIINQAVTKGLNPDVPMRDSGIEWLGEVPEHWKFTKLMYLTTRIGDGLHGTPKYVDESSYHFINGNNLVKGSISITDSTRCVSKDAAKEHEVTLDSSTLLMSINGTIGNVAFYQNESVILGKSVAYINCKKDISRFFLYYFLQSSSVGNYVDGAVTGTTIFNLSLESIRNMPIVLPAFNEQLAIVDYLNIATSNFEKIISQIQQQITLLKEYRIALISEAVTGKIDLRNQHEIPTPQ